LTDNKTDILISESIYPDNRLSGFIQISVSIPNSQIRLSVYSRNW